MNKIQDKIVHADFKKIARRFIAAWLYQAATKARMKRVIWCIAGLICNLAAVVVFLFSWLVFRETLSKKAAVGLAGIVAGTLLLLF